MFKNIIDYTRNLWGFKKKPDIKKPRVITRDEHGIDRRQVSREALRTCENLQAGVYENRRIRRPRIGTVNLYARNERGVEYT